MIPTSEKGGFACRMPNVAQGLLITLAVFCFCFSFVFLLRFGRLYANFLKKEKEGNSCHALRTANENENAEKDADPKIYYICKKEKRKPRRKTRKKPDIALKGIVLKPEQFRRIEDDKDI